MDNCGASPHTPAQYGRLQIIFARALPERRGPAGGGPPERDPRPQNPPLPLWAYSIHPRPPLSAHSYPVHIQLQEYWMSS